MTQGGVRGSLRSVLGSGCDTASVRSSLRSVLGSGCDAAEFEKQFNEDFRERMRRSGV